MKKTIIGAIALFLIPMTANASTEYWSSDWWSVHDTTDKVNGPSCALGTEDVGVGDRSSLFTVLHYDGASVIMSLSNDDWSVVDGTKYPSISITFFDSSNKVSAVFDGADWIGTSSDSMAVKSEVGILDDFARSQSVMVFRDETNETLTTIGKINLNGSALAISKLRECYMRAKTRYDAQTNYDRLVPRNPFA